MRVSEDMVDSSAPESWSDFIEGPVYPDNAAPWRPDPAYATILEHPGLRDSIGSHVAPALRQAVGLVQAMAQVNVLDIVRSRRPAIGLSLGFGSNAQEPYDLLETCELDCVHAYEWIGGHIIEAAKAFETLRANEPRLTTRIRLHHGTVSDLRALNTASIHLIYTANLFNREIPMSEDTFERSLQEIVRVLAPSGCLISRGSAGVLEQQLAQYLHVLLENPLVSVLQKEPVPAGSE